MSEKKDILVRAWIQKGRSDLETARLLIKGVERHLDTGVYHCQQAAEKHIKGWLTSRDVSFIKTHDLDLLLQSCAAIDSSLLILKAEVELLTPFATEFRYPGDLFEPSQDDADAALSASTVVCDLFRGKLSGII